MATYGSTPAGFVVKPLSAILSDMQGQVLSTIDPNYDLTPQTPDGQMMGIYAASSAAIWELIQIAYNQINRQDTEGAGLDNVGDFTGTPREGTTYTQVYCTLTLAAGTYTAGQLVANVAGNQSYTFANLNSVTSTGGANTVLMQSTVAGPTPTVSAGSLTQITTPVTGWTAITNTAPQSQLGLAEESDNAYMIRQIQDVAAEGSCNPSATVAALNALGAAQVPPVQLSASTVENTSSLPLSIAGLPVIPAKSYAIVLYENDALGWLGTTAGQQAVGHVIYANKPAGILPVGNSSVVIQDPALGPMTMTYSQPVGLPLYISATVVPRPGVSFPALQTAIQTALVAAAVAPTPPNGTPPVGQLLPGADVIGSQLNAVISGVPGVYDVPSLTFGFSASPVNTAPLVVDAVQIATILQSTVSSHIILTQGTGP